MDKDTTKLDRVTKYGYGTGHIMNDMCNALYFTYLLLFYMNVVGLSPVYAGIIMLVGQISDGIATVAVGILQDRASNFGICIRYGKRKVKLGNTML